METRQARHVNAGVRGDGMQMRSKAYLQMIARLRAVCGLMPPSKEPLSQEASPLLILIAVVLGLLLAILEIDLHSADLQALGLMGDAVAIDPTFKSP